MKITPSNPGLVMEQNLAFVTARSLHTAVELELFTHLSKNPMTAKAISKCVDADPNSLEKLLNVLVLVGLLERENDNFNNSHTAEAFLIKGKPGYMGPLIEQGRRIWQCYDQLTEVIRTGQPAEESKAATKACMANNPEAARTFTYAMHGIATGVAKQLVEAVDLSGRRSLLDVGGGAGTHSISFVKANPQLQATVLDLPNVIKVADEIISTNNLSDKIQTQAGDWNQLPFGTQHDVILMSQVLHIEKPEGALELLQKAYSALPNGGQLITMHFLMNPEKSGPWFPVVFNLNMLVELGTQGFSTSEIQRLLRQIGFKSIKVIPLRGPQTVISAVKP